MSDNTLYVIVWSMFFITAIFCAIALVVGVNFEKVCELVSRKRVRAAVVSTLLPRRARKHAGQWLLDGRDIELIRFERAKADPLFFPKVCPHKTDLEPK
jgi:hypothetical protein